MHFVCPVGPLTCHSRNRINPACWSETIVRDKRWMRLLLTRGLFHAAVSCGGERSTLNPRVNLKLPTIRVRTEEAFPLLMFFAFQRCAPIRRMRSWIDSDGARHAVINTTADGVHSGFIVASAQERTGLAQLPPGVTRFRVTFTNPGTYPYICAIHDELGMKGTVIVLP